MRREHDEIIEDGDGWRAVRDKLGLAKSDTRPKFWYHRKNIPGVHWAAFVRAGLATFEELAAASERQKYLKERGDRSPKPGRPSKADAA